MLRLFDFLTSDNLSARSVNWFRFYRMDFVLRNLGLTLVAVLASGWSVEWSRIAVAFALGLLVQMHSFSANDWFDHLAWGERSAAGAMSDRRGLLRAAIASHIPLLPAFILCLHYYHPSHWLLAVYVVAFMLYQMPPFRWKDHYLSSLLLNALCLGAILFLHPYWFLQQEIDRFGLWLTLLFFFYLSFHEVVHQIAHWRRDHIRSFPEVFGLNGARWIACLQLMLAILAAIAGCIWSEQGAAVFLCAALFSLLRLTLVAMRGKDVLFFQSLRNSWHKFYAVHEGAIYAAILLGSY